MGNLVKWFDTKLEFEKKRISKDPLNTPVTNAGVTDTPEVKWGNIVFIGDTGEIWTHGKYMGGSVDIENNPTILEIKDALGDIENLLKEL